MISNFGEKRGLSPIFPDTLNAFMAIPNLIALVLLAPVVVRLTNEYFAERRVADSPLLGKAPR